MRKPKDHGARRALRWARNIVLGIVGLVAFVLVAAYIVFSTGPGREFLRAQIETQMNNKIIGGAKVGGLEGNPFTELVLKDVVLNGPDKQPAISVKRLTVKLPLMPLISNELRVAKLIADDLDVHIKKDAQGQINVANLTKKGDPSTWTIKLPDVQVHRGHVRLDLGKEPVDLDNIELYVDAAMPFAGPIDAALSLSADWRQKKLPVDVAGSIHIDDETTQINSLAAQLGDIDVFVTNFRAPKSTFSMPFAGVVSVYAPKNTVRALVPPTVNIPGDIALALTATPDGRLTHVGINGAVGTGAFQVLAQADIQAKLAKGIVTADHLDFTQLTSGKLDGQGGAVVVFDVDANDPKAEFPTLNAMITAWGQAGKAPPTRAVIAIDSEGERLRTTVGASSTTGLRATLEAAIRKTGEKVTLERGVLLANVADTKRATQGIAQVPLRGGISANLRASGAIAPEMDLAVSGHANGRRMRMNDISADSFRLNIDAKHLPKNPVGTARLEVVDLQRAGMEFGKLTVAAGNRPDGKLQVSVRSQPKQAPWLVDLDALVTTGNTVVVDLQRHLVRASGGTVWKGDSGRIAVGPREVTVRGFESTSSQGFIRADATYIRAGRDTGDLDAWVTAKLQVQNIKKAYRGTANAKVNITRENGRLAGNVVLDVDGLALDPRSPMTLDADATIIAQADKLLADISLTTLKAGDAKILVDVDAPKDIANTKAWSTLGRKAIRTAQVEFNKLDIAALGKVAGVKDIAGSIDGKIELTPDSTSGLIEIRGVETKQTRDLGTIIADLKVEDAGPNEVKTYVAARLEPNEAALAAKEITKDGAARVFLDARFKTPARLFDPQAWAALGAKAFRGGALRAERFAFQPGTLERFGIVSDMRGELSVGAELDEGMDALRFAVNLHQLQGGAFAKPIAINVSGGIDEKSTRVVANIHGQNVTLLKVTSHIPVSLAELRANPQAAKTAPLTATATIDQVPARALLTVLGTSQVSGGTLNGTIKVAGTVAKPTVNFRLMARDVTVPPESGEPTQGIELLTINAVWDGEAGRVAIDGDQSAGGKLMIRAAGSPSDLAAATASIDARKVDLAPLVAFMPGPAGGLGGRMDANFTLKGADPKTAELVGDLRITNGRIPIAPAVGTLFKGDVKLGVRNRNVNLAVSGKLGRGDLKLVASAPLEGTTPKSGNLTLTIDDVQLIGTTQPIISGVIKADVARVDEIWQANLRIDGMEVKVPKEKGTKLSPVGRPADIVYGGEKIHHGKNKGMDVPQGIVRKDGEPVDFKPPSQVAGPVAKRAPGAPVAVARIVIRNVFVESQEVRGLVGGNLRVTVAETKEVGVIGRLGLTRGVLDLFNRRYQVDKANLQFDGSLDPVLDVRIMHDFREVTTITEVRGRMSKPELILSSEPAQYTQAELLGFLLGGEPGGDPENAPTTTQRVAGAGASFIGNKVGGYVKKALPVDIDVLRYEAASSTSSAAVTVGTWVTDSLFLAYRRHLEARPDENAGEGEVEYWLRRRLVLEAVAGDRGIHWVDLLWRRRW